MRNHFFALIFAAISLLGLSTQAIAACTAPVIGSDLVLRFPAAQGVWAGGASSINAENHLNTAFNTAGVLYYDATENALKLCDGTDWVELGAGGGVCGLTCAFLRER